MSNGQTKADASAGAVGTTTFAYTNTLAHFLSKLSNRRKRLLPANTAGGTRRVHTKEAASSQLDII